MVGKEGEKEQNQNPDNQWVRCSPCRPPSLRRGEEPGGTAGAEPVQEEKRDLLGFCEENNSFVKPLLYILYRVFFLTGPPLNLLSVGR